MSKKPEELPLIIMDGSAEELYGQAFKLDFRNADANKAFSRKITDERVDMRTVDLSGEPKKHHPCGWIALNPWNPPHLPASKAEDRSGHPKTLVTTGDVVVFDERESRYLIITRSPMKPYGQALFHRDIGLGHFAPLYSLKVVGAMARLKWLEHLDAMAHILADK